MKLRPLHEWSYLSLGLLIVSIFIGGIVCSLALLWSMNQLGLTNTSYTYKNVIAMWMLYIAAYQLFNTK